MNKTFKELQAMAKELGIKGYSKLNKAELEKAVIIANQDVNGDYSETLEDLEMPEDVAELLSNETVVTQDMVEIKKEGVQMERVLNSSEVKDFVNKYKGFTLYESLRGNAPMVRQLNLAKAIENNFEVKIPVSTYKTAGELSDDLAKLLTQIDNGTLKARPKTVVAELVKSYKPTTAPVAKNITTTNPASKAQIAYINRLEKETGIVNHRIVSDVKVANEIIQQYLKLKKEQTILSEVAVASTVEEKLASQTFRTKFQAMMKRIFA